jgi:hypothetical protein
VCLIRKLLLDCRIRSSRGMKRPVVLERHGRHADKWRHLYYRSCERAVTRRIGVTRMDVVVVVRMVMYVWRLLRTWLLLV